MFERLERLVQHPPASAALDLWWGPLRKPGPIGTSLETFREQVSNSSHSETIRVVSWNLSWGYGFGSEGSGPPKPASHFARGLQEMAETLHRLRPDVVLLQEVDFGSRRSHYQDQLTTIAEGSGLGYGSRIVSWAAPWVPYPYWPISEQFGTMRSGGAILSRHPLTRPRGWLLEKPPQLPPLHRRLYLFRYLQSAVLQHPTGPLQLFNLHLEAYHLKNRVAQAQAVNKIIREESIMPGRTICGGDFNTVPRTARLRHAYADEPHTDHRNDPTLLPFASHFREAFDEETKEVFTFPAHAPNRRLDHVFAAKELPVSNAEVVQTETPDLSDHLPLVIDYRTSAA